MELFDGLNINKISDKYREELESKRLALGESAMYKFLNPARNPDPDAARNPETEFVYPLTNYIRGRDTIKDPYANGKLVDIGVVDRLDDNGKPVFCLLTVNTKDTKGYIAINGGDLETEKFYQFLEICNENASNPHRNTNIPARFERVDAEKDAKKANKDFDTLTEMLLYVKDLNLSEKKELASAFGWDRNDSDEIITRRLREAVQKDCYSFKVTVGNKNDLSIRSVINDALKASVIVHFPQENKYQFVATEETICTLARVSGKDSVDQLVEWVKTSAKGDAVIKNIKKQLAAKSPSKGE